MERVIACMLVSFMLNGCTIALGNAYSTRGQTQEQLDLANVQCTQEASLAWEGSFGKQTGAFFLGFIIIGIPVAIAWERSVKRSTWQNCMTRRGYRVEPPR